MIFPEITGIRKRMACSKMKDFLGLSELIKPMEFEEPVRKSNPLDRYSHSQRTLRKHRGGRREIMEN